MTNDLGIDWDKAEEVDAEGNSLSHGIDWENAPEVDESGNPIVTAKGDAPIPIASKETSEIKGKVGAGEFSQLSYERDTGADAPKNPILATIANMGATVGGKLNANLQMSAAQKLAADGNFSDADIDELMDEMIYGGVKKVADVARNIPVGMPGMLSFKQPVEQKRVPNEIMKDWDDTFGKNYTDPEERSIARKEYAKQIASDFIKERTAVKQNAETELSNREVSTMGAIVGEGLGMVGYSLPYMLGPAGIALQFAEESAANATGLMNDEYGYDENGNFRLVAKGDDAERAWAMGAASAGIETATEVALGRLGGAAIKRALKPVGKIGEAVIGKFPVVEKIGEKFAATKVGEASAKFAAGLKNILGYTRRKLKIGDFFEENLEEYESGFLNAVLGSEMRESELGDSTAWSRLKDFHKEFFKPEKLLEMNEAMVLTMGGGAFVAHCAQRKALKTVDDIIRRNELMTEEELGKADLRTKAMALEAWTDKMGEDEIVNRFKKANGIIENLVDAIAGESGKEASEIVRLSKEFAARNAQYLGEELEKLNIPEQKFEIPRTADGKVDFKKVYLLNMKTGETVLHNMAADTESGIFITDNGEKGESAFSVFSPDGKTSRDFASLNEAIEHATMMKNKLALDRAKDDLKRQYIRNEVERNYQGAPNQILDFKTIEEAVEASKELGVDVTASPNFKADKSGWRLKDGTVILVRDNITSPKSVSETLRHEIVGHSDAAMDVKFMEGAKRGVGQVGLNYEFGKLKMELAGRTDVKRIEETALREAVANYLMHRRHEARIGDKAVSAIRQMMREKLGFKLSVSDAELEARISKVEKEFRRGKGGNLNSADAQGGAWKIQGEVEENIEAPEETTEEVVEEEKKEEPKAESAEDSRAAYLNEVGEFATDADKKFAQVATEEEIAKAREILKEKGADSEYSKLVNDVNAAADKAAEEASKAAGVETMERVSDLKSYIEAKPNLSEAERASLQGAVVKVANSDDMMSMGADEAIFNTLLRHGSLMLLKPNTVDKSDAHLPNFKLDVNPKTGIGKPLEGKWIPSMGGFGVVWMMKDGTLVQGTGRHRSNKADEANAPMWNVVLREADGWTKEKVSLLDGIFNIKDGKGSIADYVRFFEDSKFTREDADEYGLLGKESNGLAAWSIYADATPATRNATDIAGTGEDGKITVEQAATIAQSAPKDGDKKNVAIQAALVRAAKKGMRGAKFEGYCREMARQLREGKIGENLLVGEQMDLFADETFLAMEKLAEERAKYRAKRSNEYVEIARALRNAVNNGTKLNITDAFAQDLGITDKKDKEQLKKALEKAQERADYWNPQGDRILDQADVEKMDVEINEKADNLAKKLAGIKAKREGKKVAEVKGKETKEEDSFTSLKKGGLGGAGSSKSFDAGDGKHVDVTRWPNGTYSVDIVKNYQALRERVWLPADATNEQIQKAVDEAMTFNPTEPKKKAAKKGDVSKKVQPVTEKVVEETSNATEFTLGEATKKLVKKGSKEKVTIRKGKFTFSICRDPNMMSHFHVEIHHEDYYWLSGTSGMENTIAEVVDRGNKIMTQDTDAEGEKREAEYYSLGPGAFELKRFFESNPKGEFKKSYDKYDVSVKRTEKTSEPFEYVIISKDGVELERGESDAYYTESSINRFGRGYNGEPKVVVSKTETTTPMTLENAKKTLGVGFFAPIKDLKAELAKTPEQATKKREALKLAIAEAEKRAKADDDKKPPTPPKGKVKGLELDEATDKAATEALNDVDFMSDHFELFQYGRLIGEGNFQNEKTALKRAHGIIAKSGGNHGGVRVVRVDKNAGENDTISADERKSEAQVESVLRRAAFGLGGRSSLFANVLRAGAANAGTIGALRGALIKGIGGGQGGSLPKLYSLVPKHSWELGNGARRYYAGGDVAIQIYSASPTYRVESVKTALRKILALSEATGNFRLKTFAEGPSGSIFAIGKGRAFKKIPRPDETTVDRILHYEYGLERRPSRSAEGGDYYAADGYGTPMASAKSLSFGEDSSGGIFLVDGDFDMMRDEKVDFMSAEFDYEKFGKLVTGVGKLVDTLNKGGYNDFASLARFIASKDAEKYEKAKAVLQDVWNALAKQKGLKRVSDETADEVYGTIDAELKGEDNGRTNSGDQRSDAGDGGSLAGALPGDGALASTQETVRAEGVRGVEEGTGTTGEGAGGGSGLAVGDNRGGRDSSSGRGRRGGRPGNGEEAQGGSGGLDRRSVSVRPENGQGEQRAASDGVDAGANGNQGGLDAGGSERGTRGRGSEGESNGVAPSVKKAANKAANKNVPPEHPDFVMTPAVEEAILERSPIKRVMNNVAAIRLLQKLKERDFKATPEEQSTLAKYVGWGGLSEIFTREYEIAWSFEKDGEVERAKNHAKGAKYGLEGYEAFKELRQTLNDEEYADARATTLTAFYTPIPMVRAEHAALRKLGVLGGRFLGPSAGVGNYASAAGEYVKAVNWQFVEKDQVSGQILKALFPNQRVHIGGYEETKLADSFFDFAIDNVPYADVDITDKSLDKGSYKIHDYFFAKTLSKVRPGGVIMFLTSTGTLDKTDGKLRQFLSRNGGKIIGAVRLPNGFFSKNAGTDVASDLVIIQRVSGEADNSGFMQQEKYGETTSYVRRQGQVSVPLTYNKYFADHPEQIVGEMKAGTGQYGRPMLEYKMPSGNLFEQVEAAIDRALAGVDKDAMMKNAPAAVQKDHTPIYDNEGLRQGNITLKDGKVYEKSGDQLVEAEMPTLNNKQKKALAIKGLVPRTVVEKVIGVRKALRAVVDAQVNGVSDEELQPLIDELNKVYDAFVKKVGTFHDKNVAPFVMLDKADGNRLMTMEKVTKGEDGKNKIEKADILKKRVIFTYQKPTKADTLDDALTISFSETGALDLARIGELLGVSEEEAETKLKEEGKAFENPQTGRIEPYWEYLSGHVRRKLDAARAATANDPQFRKNVEELEKVQPKDVSLDEVTIKFGATWVDPEAMIDFLKEVYDIRGYASVKLTKNDTVNKWNLELPRSNIEPFGAISFTQEHFLEAVLNSGSLEVKAKDPVTEKYYLLERETEAQKLAAEKLHEAFARFLRTNEKWFESSSKSFNYAMNDNVAMKLPKDILPLRAAGMNEDTIKKLDAPGREYQPAVIARGVLGGKSLCLAHCVGAGKTLEMQSIGMIGRHLGMFKKSMYVVPNHMLDQFCNEFISAFPNANILKMSTEDVNPKNRRAFFAKVANGDWDAIVVKHSTFSKKLPMTEAWQKEYLQKEVDRLVEAKLAAKGDNGTVKDIEKMIQSAKDKIKKLDGSDQKDNQIVPFEELGVDQLFVDEAHNFKGLPIVSGQARKVKGLAQGDSQRALDMEMKTIYVQSLHGGKRGVVFATGTPLSNAPVVEAYVQLRYLAPWALEEQGIRTFDDFVNTFGKIETESEFGIDGKSTKEVQRVTAFVNIPEMMRLFKSVVDIVNSDQIKVKRPKQVLEAIPVPMSDVQAAVMEMVAHESAIPPSKEERQKFLQLSGIAKRVCISPRLVGLDDDGYKIAACANKVKEVYDQTSDKRGAQLIFTDIFNSSESDGVVKYVGSIGGLERDKKSYNLNAALKEMLVRSGIPAEQIGIIHDVDKAKGGDEGKDAAKEELFAKVRSGEIRVLIGSRPRMGEGTNVQERLAAIHLLHPGWKPSEDTQAIGRIIRPGNIYETGKVYYYLTQGNKNVGSYETKNHELIGVKDRLIQAVMHGDETIRTIDLDESAAERDMLMGLASANKDLIELIDVKRVLHKAELNVESVGFSARSNADNAERTRSQLEKLQNEYEDQERSAKEWRKQNPDGSFVLTTADGRTLEKPKDIADYVSGEIAKLLAKDRSDREDLTEIGNFGGVPLNVNYTFYDNKIHLSIPSIGYAKEIVYAGFIPDFVAQSAVAMKSKVLGLVSPDIEKYHQQILADTKSRIAKLESDAKRFKEEYEAEKKKLAKLRYEKERLERAVTPLVVKTLESHKWSTYGNWIIGKRDDGYIAQRQTDRKQLKARTVKELLPKIDNEDFLSPLQSTKQTMNLPSASNNGSEEASKDVAVEDVDFMSEEFEAPLTDSEKEYAAAEDKTPTEEVSRKVFGMTNEEIATEMRAAGIEPARGERKSDAKTFQQAQILLSDRSYMVKLARAVNRANRPTKDYENIALNLFFQEQKEAVNRLQDDINDLSSAPAWDSDEESVQMMKDIKEGLKEAKALMREAGQAAISGASEQGRALRSNRFLFDAVDYSYAGIRGAMLKSSKLAELPPELDEAAKNLAQEFKKLDEEGKALATARLKAFSEKVIEDIKNGGKERKRREMRIGDEGRRVLRNYNDALAQVEVHAKSLGGTLVGLGDQMYPTWGKFLKAIGEYHCYVNPEITEEECIAAITEDVNKFMDGVTENEVRDALTGFGHNYRQSRYDSQRLMNDLRSQARMKRQLDYMNEHDQLPPQTGMIRDEPSDEARRLAKKVQDRKKEMPEGGENRLKSLLESAKTRVKNRIADLENAIATKTAIPKIERTTRDDAELSSLRFQKDQLQKQYEALFPGEKRTMTNEERIAASERALQRVVEGLFTDLANAHAGDYRSVFERKRNASPESAKIRLLRNKIDEARRELVEIKKARYEYGMTPDEVAKYLANRMMSVERALDRTAKRLENGDVATVKKSMPKFADPAEQKRYEDLVKNNRKAIAKLAHLRELAQEATRPDAFVKAKNVAKTALAVQRLFLATLDLSAFGKQGARFYKAHPELASKAFGTALKATANDLEMEKTYDEMMSDPLVKEAVEKYGLHLRPVATSDDVEVFRDLRELTILGKNVTDIPFFGAGMLKSERHYVTYLNEISAAMYTSIINDKNRFPHGATPWQKKMICDMVNMYNGSGSLSKESRSAMNKGFVSKLLWAPGLLVSRLQFASGYDILHPFVAKNDLANAEGRYDKPTMEERMTIARIALRDRVRSSSATLALGALVMMINALANSDDEWEKWKRSHLLLKLSALMAPTFFNTTLDFSGGEAQYVSLLDAVVTGERTTGTGRKQELGSFGAPSAADLIMKRLVAYKASPFVGLLLRIADGKEIGGGDYGAWQIVRDMLIPLVIQDVYDQVKENPAWSVPVTGAASILGVAGSTYDRKPYENAVNSLSDEDREELKSDIRSIVRSERVAKKLEKRGEDASDRRKEIEAARAALLGEIREKR